jgi:hypothetical protein
MNLTKLIEASHGTAVAEAYKAFEPNAEQLETLRQVGEEAIEVFGSVTHACAPMGAAYWTLPTPSWEDGTSVCRPSATLN